MKTVLLVEDNRDVLLSTAYVLQEAGFEVVAAANAEQARSVAAVRTDIGIILTDLNLDEGPNGIELGAAMRAEGLVCPVIVMSGNAEPPEQGWLPWMTYLAKPFDRKTLLEAMADTRELAAVS